MRILVTGLKGFTGRYFADSARARGHDVYGMNANLKDKEALRLEIQQLSPEAVVHLAAISFVGHADTSEFYSVNTVGTTNLLDALAAQAIAPSKVLVASSANIYGNCEHSPITEARGPAPVNHYAASKLAMECMARTYSNRLPICITRPFNYTGPGQSLSFIIPKLVSHFHRRAATIELGNLDVEREFNDVRVICGAYLRLLELSNEFEATYNVCSGNPVTLRAVIDSLREQTDHDMKIVVNRAFVRANEVHTLCGDPTKLHVAIGDLLHPPLKDTLQWMLEAAE